MTLVLSDVRPLLAARFGFLADSAQYPRIARSRQARSGSGSATAVATLDVCTAARDPHLDPPPFRGRKQYAARSRLDDLSRAAGSRLSPPKRGRDGVGVCGRAERSKDAAQRGVQHQGGEQDQTGVAVGLEYREAVVRIADIQARDLPDEVGGEGGQPQREDH